MISRDLLVPAEERLARLLDSVAGTSDTAYRVIRENDDSLIALAARSRGVLRTLDTYALNLGCVVEALRVGNNVANHTAGSRGSFIYLTIDDFADRDPYRYPEDLPTNPRSDAHPSRLPLGVPSWAPHCSRFPPWQRNLPDAPPGSLEPLPMQPNPRESRSGSTSRSGDRQDGYVLLPGYGRMLLEPMARSSARGGGGAR